MSPVRNNDRSWRSNKTKLDLAGCIFGVQMNDCLVFSSDWLNFRVRFGDSPEGIAVEKGSLRLKNSDLRDLFVVLNMV